MPAQHDLEQPLPLGQCGRLGMATSQRAKVQAGNSLGAGARVRGRVRVKVGCGRRGHLASCGSPISPLYLPYISPISPLYLLRTSLLAEEDRASPA